MRYKDYEWEDCTREMVRNADLIATLFQCREKLREYYVLRDGLRLSVEPDGNFIIECRVPKKPPWEPKVGEWVEYDGQAYRGRGRVVFISNGKRRFLVADPSRGGCLGWHNGMLSSNSPHSYARLFPKSCLWFRADELKPVEK